MGPRVIASLLLFFASAAPVAGVAVNCGDACDLFRAETIITGTGPVERRRGFNEGLREVLIKLTGDPSVVEAPSLDDLLAEPGALVTDFSTEDRMKGIPVHDEQGTRDRPHFLRMVFDRDRLVEALQARGFSVRLGPRPPVLVWLGIDDGVRRYVLGESTSLGYGQREAVRSARRRRGFPAVLPAMDAADVASVAYDTVAAADLPILRAAAGRYGVRAVLSGALIMTPDGYWDITWTFTDGDEVWEWRFERVTFDVAIRGAFGRAVQVLAGPDTAPID